METICLFREVAARWLAVVVTRVADPGSEEAFLAPAIVACLAVYARAGTIMGSMGSAFQRA